MAATRDYRQNVARDNARVQYGDRQYGDQHHHYYARPGDGPDTTQMRDDPMQQLLASLSFPQQNYRFATIEPAHRQTCQWFLATREYTRWRDWELREAHHGIFWLKGKPGAGKSTIIKYALDHANATHTGERNISFFFNARGERLEKCTEGMYRSLLSQVARSVPSLAQSVHTETAKGYATTGWPLELLRSLFREAALSLASNARLNCYIDALDEGEDEDQAREMVRFFEELAETAVSDNIGLSIYFASRHYPNITIRHSETLILDDCGGHQADIASYVRSKLSCRPLSLKAELTAGVIERSSGIFLWAVLVVRILNAESDRGNPRRLKESLQATPKGLDELFSDIIGKGGADELLLPTLLWVSFARRPLSPLELYLAVDHSANADYSGSVICDQATVDEQSVKNFITSKSRGLLEVVAKDYSYYQKYGFYHKYPDVDERRMWQDSAVQFIHESAREYLLERGLLRLDPALAENIVGVSNLSLARWCQSYLELSLQHVIPQLNKTEVETPSLVLRSLLEVAPFSRYGLANILHHSEAAACCGFEVPIPFEDCLHGHSSLMLKLDGSLRLGAYLEGNPDYTTLHVLAMQGHTNLVIRLLQRYDHTSRTSYINMRVKSGRLIGSVALCLAILRRRIGVIQVLLKNGADVNVSDSVGKTPLIYAVEYGLTDAVLMVLGHGADVNARDKWHRTALHHAAETGNFAVIEALMRHGADVDARNAQCDTPLTIAVKEMNYATVKALLAHNPDVDAQDDNGHTSLYHAILSLEQSDRGIIEMLLQHGADVNIRDYISEPLLTAVVRTSFCDAKDVQLLLRHGADVNARDRIGGTALHAAVHRQDAEIVDTLLQNNAEVNAGSGSEGRTGRTPLRCAVEIENVEATKMLLIYGADVYSQDEEQQSIAEIARGRSEQTIARLLTYFADVDPSSRFEAASALEDEEWWKEYVGRITRYVSLSDEEENSDASRPGETIAYLSWIRDHW